MSGAVGVSPSHLRRLFHQVLNRSPKEIVLTRRLERAQLLLRTTGMSVEEVALATGYQSLASFSRAFKTQLGQAPQYWRRLALGTGVGQKPPSPSR
jgi:transcriptional regulator GlxA family with amidase domain